MTDQTISGHNREFNDPDPYTPRSHNREPFRGTRTFSAKYTGKNLRGDWNIYCLDPRSPASGPSSRPTLDHPFGLPRSKTLPHKDLSGSVCL